MDLNNDLQLKSKHDNSALFNNNFIFPIFF